MRTLVSTNGIVFTRLNHGLVATSSFILLTNFRASRPSPSTISTTFSSTQFCTFSRSKFPSAMISWKRVSSAATASSNTRKCWNFSRFTRDKIANTNVRALHSLISVTAFRSICWVCGHFFTFLDSKLFQVFPGKSETKLCGRQDIECVERVTNNLNVEIEKCNCLESCTSLRYEIVRQQNRV